MMDGVGGEPNDLLTRCYDLKKILVSFLCVIKAMEKEKAPIYYDFFFNYFDFGLLSNA